MNFSEQEIKRKAELLDKDHIIFRFIQKDGSVIGDEIYSAERLWDFYEEYKGKPLVEEYTEDALRKLDEIPEHLTEVTTREQFMMWVVEQTRAIDAGNYEYNKGVKLTAELLLLSQSEVFVNEENNEEIAICDNEHYAVVNPDHTGFNRGKVFSKKGVYTSGEGKRLFSTGNGTTVCLDRVSISNVSELDAPKMVDDRRTAILIITGVNSDGTPKIGYLTKTVDAIEDMEMAEKHIISACEFVDYDNNAVWEVADCDVLMDMDKLSRKMLTLRGFEDICIATTVDEWKDFVSRFAKVYPEGSGAMAIVDRAIFKNLETLEINEEHVENKDLIPEMVKAKVVITG